MKQTNYFNGTNLSRIQKVTPILRKSYQKDGDENASNKNADSVQGKLCRRVAAVCHAVGVLLTGQSRHRRSGSDSPLEQSLVEALVFFHQTLDGLDLVIFVAFEVSDLLVEFSDFRQRQLDVFAFERVSRSGKVPQVQRVPGEFLHLDGVVAVVVGVDEDRRKLLLKKN